MMTSREIAELTNKRHDNVLQVARSLAKEGITESQECQYRATRDGRSYPEHHLSKRDSLVLVARLSPEFTGRIVDRWMELEAANQSSQFIVPSTLSGALRLAAEQAETIEAQAAQLASAKPAIAFHDAVANLDGTCNISHIAKTLGHGPNKLFSRLRADKILIGKSNLPYQEYLSRGYFEVRENEPWKDRDGNMHPTFTTVVTGKGQIWLARKYPAGMNLVLKAAA